mmetsp:Transcript_3610/g.13313  ORF Transcript_3610/g.13313 Transcript_3610/m.13313 type:complete len:333 (-) Transcript_3610:393-1391(-)
MGSSGSTRTNFDGEFLFFFLAFLPFASRASRARARAAAITKGSSPGSATPASSMDNGESNRSPSDSVDIAFRGFLDWLSSSPVESPSSSPRQSNSACTKSDCRVITARPSGVIPPTPTRGSAPSLRSIRVIVAFDRSVAVSNGGIQLFGALTSAPSAMSLAAAAAWSDITASTSGVTVSCPSRRSAVLQSASISAPCENRKAIIPGRPPLAATNKGVASSSGRRKSTGDPFSIKARAIATHPDSAAACNAVVFRATLLTSASSDRSVFCSSHAFLQASSSANAVSSSPARHAPTNACGVTCACHFVTRCRAALNGPSASRNAAIAASSSSPP